MRFGSVCSGIEAASVAFAPMGFEAAWFSEIEPFPCRVLAHHYPDVLNHGDMTTLPEDILLGEVEAPDILCGGTPCQAFSVAGLRNSLEDARGNLSLIFCEVANAIDAVRASRGEQPAIVFWENVPGVLNTKDNAFGCFLAGLAGESVPLVAPGGKWPNVGVVVGPQRSLAWRVLDAQYFGLAQRRKRVFVVASARDGFDPARVLFESEGVRRDTPPSREAGQTTPDATSASLDSGSHIRPMLIGGFDYENNAHGADEPTGPLLKGSPTGGGRPLPAIVTRDWPAELCKTLDTTFGTKQGLDDQHINSGASMFVPTYALAGNTIGREPQNGGNGTGYDESGVSYTLTKTDVHAVCFPINTQIATRHEAMGERTGMGIGANGDPAYTIQAAHSHAVCAFHINAQPDQMNFNEHTSATLTKSQNAGIQQGMQVRRLTPKCCERLQGFPDDYTDIPKASNSARYKALGNSWAVPVVRWIGWRIWAELFT